MLCEKLSNVDEATLFFFPKSKRAKQIRREARKRRERQEKEAAEAANPKKRRKPYVYRIALAHTWDGTNWEDKSYTIPDLKERFPRGGGFSNINKIPTRIENYLNSKKTHMNVSNITFAPNPDDLAEIYVCCSTEQVKNPRTNLYIWDVIHSSFFRTRKSRACFVGGRVSYGEASRLLEGEHVPEAKMHPKLQVVSLRRDFDKLRFGFAKTTDGSPSAAEDVVASPHASDASDASEAFDASEASSWEESEDSVSSDASSPDEESDSPMEWWEWLSSADESSDGE